MIRVLDLFKAVGVIIVEKMRYTISTIKDILIKRFVIFDFAMPDVHKTNSSFCRSNLTIVSSIANKKLKGGKAKKFLDPEKQIWHNLDIIEWNNSRTLFPGEGYKFKNNRIKMLIAKFYANYGDASFKTRKLV